MIMNRGFFGIENSNLFGRFMANDKHLVYLLLA